MTAETDRAAHDAIPEAALDWHRSGRGAAIATVVETWGSAPRQAGSQLAISGEGELVGSVSGGCVEGAVVAEALEALEDGRPRLLSFGVSDEDAFSVGLACGGTIRVLVEPVATGDGVPETLLAELVAARAARRPVAVVTDIETWARRLAGPDEEGLAEMFRRDRSGMLDDRRLAVIHNPPLRLAVIGAGHIAQPLVRMARLAGFDPFLIDPRETFASAARFPGERISHDWPDEALAALAPDARTAVVALSHDPKIDDPALEVALRSDAFYIGALGSTRTHAKRVARLGAAGFSEAEISRIHAPVGLDIGAVTPAEIAVATLAEITRALRRGQ
ncbi:MAG: XdhC/CoxI family protein [Alphaproteobacteria bacterium]|nr:MAG: XdhC/CoxI family protein [Alphaproteobacteria bacterium]